LLFGASSSYQHLSLFEDDQLPGQSTLLGGSVKDAATSSITISCPLPSCSRPITKPIVPVDAASTPVVQDRIARGEGITPLARELQTTSFASASNFLSSLATAIVLRDGSKRLETEL
jgi:hypothetical protein